jgi:hypothetical protein
MDCRARLAVPYPSLTRGRFPAGRSLKTAIFSIIIWEIYLLFLINNHLIEFVLKIQQI